jgi:hypothetical protein
MERVSGCKSDVWEGHIVVEVRGCPSCSELEFVYQKEENHLAPYDIKKAGSKYVVVKKSDGKILGHHSSKSQARRQIAAIYANTKEG